MGELGYAISDAPMHKKNLNRFIPVIDVDVQYDTGLLISKDKREAFKGLASRLLKPVIAHTRYLGSTRYSISLEAIGITTDAETYTKAFDVFEQRFIAKGFDHFYDPTLSYLTISEAKKLYPAGKIEQGLAERAHHEFQNPLQKKMEKIRDEHKLQDILDAAKKLGATIAPHYKSFSVQSKTLPTDKAVMLNISLSEAAKKYKYQIVQVFTRCQKSGWYESYHPRGKPAKITTNISNSVNNFLDRLENSLN
jgi:hypothetical protein